MKKRVILFLSFVVLLISFSGCSDSKKQNDITTAQAISEIKTVACNTADSAGTCFTRLPELGIISPEECCTNMGKCCNE